MRGRLLLLIAVASLPLSAQQPAPAGPDIKSLYTKSEHMIPMRDGVKLFTIVYSPKNQAERYPFMIHRTPYGSPPYGPEAYRGSLGPSIDFVREGFIFVYQDVRGKFRSEGEFTVMRPIHPSPSTPKDTDESTDTYDPIDWLLKNIPNNNGRAGQWGVSYPGSQTVWGMVRAHAALKASSPQAPAIDMFLGDDFHHNGAFRLMYTFSWLAGNARPRAGATETRGAAFDYGTIDGYRFFLDVGPVANINEKYFNYSVPTWNEYMDNPNYNEYWERQNPLKHLKNVSHAILNVADQALGEVSSLLGQIQTLAQASANSAGLSSDELAANQSQIDNAISAVRGRGNIHINTSHDPLVKRVRLEIADDGTGIADADKSRLFEPNFSTKKAGMGLGLTIVSTIVQDHHGLVRVEDNLPRGAKFVIELPY